MIASDASLRRRQSAQSARDPEIVRLDSNRPAEQGARLVEVLQELRANRDRGFHAFAHLLEVAFAGAATLEARFDVAEDSAMRRDVFVCKRDQVREAHHVDIGLRGIERDQLSALAHAIGSSVNARGLPPDFVDRGESIKQQLTDDDGCFALR